MQRDYEADHVTDISLVKEEYYLHDHKSKHEILLFVDGDCEFRAEANLYKIKPYDVLLASCGELHEMVHISEARYERYVLTVDTDFFAKNGCLEFARVFEAKEPGQRNLISAEEARESGIIDAIERVCRYNEAGEHLVARSVLVELLYLLNTVSPATRDEGEKTGYVREIVHYINENLNADLSLERLSLEFHLSPSQISRLFKSHMKTTVKKYISYKRLSLATELVAGGMSLLDASMEAGFTSYSSFYRMYVEEFGSSPRDAISVREDRVST